MSDNGRLGERYAAGSLERKGYKIAAQNFRCKFGEIDIIAEKGDIIAFIEVKTRAADSFYRPVEAVTAAKRRKLIKTAQLYMLKSQSALQPRFDIFEVITADKDGFRVLSAEHIEDAFWL